MNNLINQDGGVPASTPYQRPRIVLSNSPKKESIVIDINGNILSSKNPHEAHIIGQQNFND